MEDEGALVLADTLATNETVKSLKLVTVTEKLAVALTIW